MTGALSTCSYADVDASVRGVTGMLVTDELSSNRRPKRPQHDDRFAWLVEFSSGRAVKRQVAAY